MSFDTAWSGAAVAVNNGCARLARAWAPDHPQAESTLSPRAFQHYVDEFNSRDQELYVQHVPNGAAWSFLSTNMPLFECPDRVLERCVEAIDGCAGLFRSLWPHHRRTTAPAVCGLVSGTRMPMEWAQLAVRNGSDAHRAG